MMTASEVTPKEGSSAVQSEGSRLAPPLPIFSWPHIRDALLLLLLEVAISLGFHYAQEFLPVSPRLLREPQRVLQWFMLATVCWLFADPLLRLLNNTRRGISGADDRLVSIGIERDDSDGKTKLNL